MNTTTQLSAGLESGPVPEAVSSTAVNAADRPHHHHGGARSGKAWLYRRIMRSGVAEPFRKVLRPLIRWVLQPHVGVHDEADHTIPVRLRQPSLFTIVMTIILSPVIFFILLPLLIVLFPVALIIGTIAMLVPLFSGEMDGDASPARPFAKHFT